MDFINLKSLNLTAEESKDLIKFLAQKRGITAKKLLSTIKPNLKRNNNKIATKVSKNAIRSTKITTKINKIYKNTTKINKTNKFTKRIN